MSRDPYFDNIQKTTDPIIRKALEHMLDAARGAFRVRDLLHDAVNELDHHPDYIATERARRKGQLTAKSVTLAAWARTCALAALHDAPVADAGYWLLEESNPEHVSATLRELQRTERREAEARTPHKARRPSRAKRPALRVVRTAEVAA